LSHPLLFTLYVFEAAPLGVKRSQKSKYEQVVVVVVVTVVVVMMIVLVRMVVEMIEVMMIVELWRF